MRSCHSILLSNIKTDSIDIVIEYNFLALQMVTGINAEKLVQFPMAYKWHSHLNCNDIYIVKVNIMSNNIFYGIPNGITNLIINDRVNAIGGQIRILP